MYVFCIMGILLYLILINLNTTTSVNLVGPVFDSLNGIKVNSTCFYVLKVSSIFVLY